jgi:hypothetical protein
MEIQRKTIKIQEGKDKIKMEGNKQSETSGNERIEEPKRGKTETIEIKPIKLPYKG